MAILKSRRQTPADLPERYRWASEEIVDSRLLISQLNEDILTLRVTLMKVTGDNTWMFEYKPKFRLKS